MTDFGAALDLENDENPLVTAGLTKRFLMGLGEELEGTPMHQAVSKLAVGLLRTDSITSHTDKDKPQKQSKRILNVTNALTNLRDHDEILKGYYDDLKNSPDPLGPQIEAANFRAERYIDKAARIEENSSAGLFDLSKEEGPHMFACKGKRIWLVDPMRSTGNQANEADRKVDKLMRKSSDRFEKKMSELKKYPDEATKTQYEERIRQEQELACHRDCYTEWFIRTLQEEKPDLCKQIEKSTDERTDFPRDVIEEYKERYEKTPEKKRFDELVAKEARKAFEREHVSLIESDLEDYEELLVADEEAIALSEIYRPETHGALMDKLKYPLEIDDKGNLTVIKNGEREALEDIRLVGTILSREVIVDKRSAGKMNININEQLASQIFWMKDYFPEAGAVPHYLNFSEKDLANLILYDQEKFQPILRSSPDPTTVSYLVGCVSNGKSPPYFRILGEVWGIEDLSETQTLHVNPSVPETKQEAKKPEKSKVKRRAKTK